MNYIFNENVPIFIQLRDYLENDILNGVYKEDEQIPSTTELSSGLKLNPQTILKAINLLVDDEILVKKRGIGMFVKKGAREFIIKKHYDSFISEHILPLLKKAQALEITKNDLIKMIEEN